MGAAGIATALLVPVVVVWTTVLVAIGALGLVTASFIYRLRSRRVADLIGRAKKQFAVLVEEHERSMARYTAAWESKKAEVDAVNAIGLREWTAGRDLEVEVAQTAWQKVKTRQESLVQRFEAGIQSYEPESVFWVIGEILRKLDCPIPLFAEVDSEDFVTISIRYALPNVESLPQYGAKRTAAGNYGIRDASASHRKKLLSALGAGLALQLAATIFRHIPRCGEVQLEGIVGHHRLALKSPLPGLALRATRDGFSFAIAKSNDPAAVLKQLGGRMRLDKEGVPYPVCLTSSATAFGIDVEFKRLGTTSKKKTCLVCGATFEDNGAEDAHLFDARGLCRAETIYIHGACSPLRKRDKGQSRRERSEALQGQSATLVVKHSAMG
jgi:hypothetical protein